MPPIIRRAPLSERIKAYLNPYDLLLWIAEELHESALDEALRDWGMPVGIVANVVFACARFGLKKNPNDDIFGELESKSGWFLWLVSSSSLSLCCEHPPCPICVEHSLTVFLSTGLVHCTFPCLRLAVQRLLHLHALAQVPPLRIIHRPSAVDTFGPPSARRLVPRCLAADVLFVHHLVQQCLFA
jgi:hypothetical protein